MRIISTKAGTNGYPVAESDGKRILEPYEPEARIVRLIYMLYTQGDEDGQELSMRKIAAKLTEMGVPTWADKRSGTYKKREFGEWSWRTVARVLRSETYEGNWHYGRRNCYTGEVNPRETWLALEVPAIVSQETWRRAQEQCEHNRTRIRRNVKRNYLLRGRTTCSNDGSSMCGYSTVVRGKVYQYY